MSGFIDAIIDIFRRLIRPGATVWVLYLVGYTVTHSTVDEARVRMVFVLASLAMVFWFGERAFKALGLNLNDLILKRLGGSKDGSTP